MSIVYARDVKFDSSVSNNKGLLSAKINRYPEKCSECPFFFQYDYQCHSESGYTGECRLKYMKGDDTRDFRGNKLHPQCQLLSNDKVTLIDEETNEEIVIKSQHQSICQELTKLYEKKNADYGDSFHETYLQEGMAMARIRLGDKYRRFCTLSKNSDNQQVKEETIRDTLLDLANYAIMTVMEIDNEKNRD